MRGGLWAQLHSEQVRQIFKYIYNWSKASQIRVLLQHPCTAWWQRPAIRRKSFCLLSKNRLKWEENITLLKPQLCMVFFFLFVFFSIISNPFSPGKSVHKMEKELQHALKASPGTVIVTDSFILYPRDSQL